MSSSFMIVSASNTEVAVDCLSYKSLFPFPADGLWQVPGLLLALPRRLLYALCPPHECSRLSFCCLLTGLCIPQSLFWVFILPICCSLESSSAFSLYFHLCQSNSHVIACDRHLLSFRHFWTFPAVCWTAPSTCC